jgi:hypothetical protein
MLTTILIIAAVIICLDFRPPAKQPAAFMISCPADGRAQNRLWDERFGVSYCEVRRDGYQGLLRGAVMTRVNPGCIGLAERTISRCRTYPGLCGRLNRST